MSIKNKVVEDQEVEYLKVLAEELDEELETMSSLKKRLLLEEPSIRTVATKTKKIKVGPSRLEET